MPSKLYVYLKNGSYVHVTDAWNGAIPSDEGTFDNSTGALSNAGREVGEPYRDIYRADGNLVSVYSGSNFSTQKTLSALTFTNPSLVPAQGLSASIAATTSDEINHVKPRLFTKVCTWLVFTATEGTYKFRKAHVIGWGANPLTE